jgi:hypothetical protein
MDKSEIFKQAYLRNKKHYEEAKRLRWKKVKDAYYADPKRSKAAKSRCLLTISGRHTAHGIVGERRWLEISVVANLRKTRCACPVESLWRVTLAIDISIAATRAIKQDYIELTSKDG